MSRCSYALLYDLLLYTKVYKRTCECTENRQGHAKVPVVHDGRACDVQETM